MADLECCTLCTIACPRASYEQVMAVFQPYDAVNAGGNRNNPDRLQDLAYIAMPVTDSTLQETEQLVIGILHGASYIVDRQQRYSFRIGEAPRQSKLLVICSTTQGEHDALVRIEYTTVANTEALVTAVTASGLATSVGPGNEAGWIEARLTDKAFAKRLESFKALAQLYADLPED
jgi:hypothetical protein